MGQLIQSRNEGQRLVSAATRFLYQQLLLQISDKDLELAVNELQQNKPHLLIQKCGKTPLQQCRISKNVQG